MTRGVVYAEPGAAPAVEELTIDPIGKREVLVRVLACGLCHTDLHVVETEGWGMPFPILLGHEGAPLQPLARDDHVGHADQQASRPPQRSDERNRSGEGRNP